MKFNDVNVHGCVRVFVQLNLVKLAYIYSQYQCVTIDFSWDLIRILFHVLLGLLLLLGLVVFFASLFVCFSNDLLKYDEIISRRMLKFRWHREIFASTATAN